MTISENVDSRAENPIPFFSQSGFASDSRAVCHGAVTVQFSVCLCSQLNEPYIVDSVVTDKGSRDEKGASLDNSSAMKR